MDGLAVDAELPYFLPVRRNGLRDKELGYRSAGDLAASLRLPDETACVVSASITARKARSAFAALH